MKIEVIVKDGGEVEVVAFEEGEGSGGKYENLPMPGRNVGRVYEKFKDGVEICTFEDAVERHEFIEAMYKENGYTED